MLFTLTCIIIQILHAQTFEYSFRLTLRKLEFYTRVHKKDVSFVAL